MADWKRIKLGFQWTAKGTNGIDVTREALDVKVAGKLFRAGVIEF